MRDAAVQDDSGLYARFDRIDRSLDLGDHAARDRAVRDQRLGFSDLEVGYDLALFVENAFDIGEQDQAFGGDRACDGAGHRVGVDVVGLSLRVNADRRHDRDQVGIHDHPEHFGIDRLGLADKAEIDRNARARGWVELRALDLLRENQIAVLAGDADRAAARGINTGDDLFVDRT